MANNPYVNKVVYGGQTLIDISDTTATADKILQGFTAYGADGSKLTGTATSGGVDMPTFTIVWNDAWDTVISASCDKTYQECRDYCNNGICYANLHECDQSLTSEYDNLAVCIIMNNTCLKYIECYGNIKDSIYLDISYDIHGDLIVSYPSTILETKNVTQNGTVVASDDKILGSVVVNVPSSTPTLQNKTVSPSESQQSVQADSGYDGLDTVTVNAISSTYVGTGITRRSSTDLTASGATVTVPSGYYSAQASKAVASGAAGTPTASKGTVSNHSVSVTPSVTNTTGYITGGTKTGTAVTVSASELVSGTLTISSSGTKDVTNYASASVAAGTEGTPTATKGTVSNHSISVTPKVTNSAGYIAGSTKTGTAVTVLASELVSGTLSLTDNGTEDCTNYASVNVNIPFVTYYTGTSDPASSLGSNGDIYLKVVS